jgi:hypothetical protein
MKQETIEALITCLTDECGYTFTGAETIRNREALVLVSDRTGILPQRGDDLFRYLVYKATGETLVIKNDDLIAKIKASVFVLPGLTDDQMVALAASFLRMKPLWLAFKQAHASNRPVVNRLAKLAPRHHQAVPANVLASLTSTVFPDDEVVAAARRAPTPQIVRALNAVRFYAADNAARYYRIRNGKSWAAQDGRQRGHLPLDRYQAILLDALQERVGEQAIHSPDLVDFAFPTSEKLFVGAIPTGTRVHVPATDQQHILVGIYWENGDASHVDLDLSAIGADGSKVGWNASWRTDGCGLIYSGDVTNAPNGATEWVYGRQIEQPYLVAVNAYSAPEGHPFKIVVGYGDNDRGTYQNYIIDPNRVLFSADACCTQQQMLLGILLPAKDGGMTFVLIGQAMGNKIVSLDGEHETTARQALVVQAKTALLLADVLPEHTNGTDLTGTVAVGTLLSLLDSMPAGK